MIKTDKADTERIWAQLHGELASYSIEGVDASGENMFLYVRGATKKWAIICAGTVKIASIPEIDGNFNLRPQYFAGHSINYIRPTYPEIEEFWELEPSDKFMSIDNVSIELFGQHFSFLLQIDKLGISMMDE